MVQLENSDNPECRWACGWGLQKGNCQRSLSPEYEICAFHVYQFVSIYHDVVVFIFLFLDFYFRKNDVLLMTSPRFVLFKKIKRLKCFVRTKSDPEKWGPHLSSPPPRQLPQVCPKTFLPNSQTWCIRNTYAPVCVPDTTTLSTPPL